MKNKLHITFRLGTKYYLTKTVLDQYYFNMLSKTMGDSEEKTFQKNYLFLKRVFEETVYLTLGASVCIGFLIFSILSIPVIIFRHVATPLAKWARPDLGDVLNPLSFCLAQDLFTERPPRANIVVTIKFKVKERDLSHEEAWKNRVMRNWIEAVDEKTGKLKFPKFQQYTTSWLGFLFYKKASDTFDINNHLHFHENLGEKMAKKEEILNFTEKLLNAPHPPKQSPWEIHIISNYQSEELHHANENMGVFILKIHHSLADGYSILYAVAENLFEHPISDEDLPTPRIIQRSCWKQAKYWVCLPFSAMYEMIYALSQIFRPNPWRIYDDRKAWHQYCCKSDLISIQSIKDIKNSFGVSFTSVLLSAISAGIHKNLALKKSRKELNPEDDPEKIFYLSTLPLPGHNKRLTNHVMAAVFEMTTSHFHDPLDRLYNMEDTLAKAKGSVIPLITRFFVHVCGSHVSSICMWIMKRAFIPTGLTNFPSIPAIGGWGENKITEVDFAVGGLVGGAGVTISVLSYEQNIIVATAAEQGLMTKEEISTFIKDIVDEITLLDKLATHT